MHSVLPSYESDLAYCRSPELNVISGQLSLAVLFG